MGDKLFRVGCACDWRAGGVAPILALVAKQELDQTNMFGLHEFSSVEREAIEQVQEEVQFLGRRFAEKGWQLSNEGIAAMAMNCSGVSIEPGFWALALRYWDESGEWYPPIPMRDGTSQIDPFWLWVATKGHGVGDLALGDKQKRPLLYFIRSARYLIHMGRNPECMMTHEGNFLNRRAYRKLRREYN